MHLITDKILTIPEFKILLLIYEMLHKEEDHKSY